MSSSPYVSGPVPIYLGVYGPPPLVVGNAIAAPASIYFLGYTENGLDIQYEHKFAPFRTDLGGETDSDESYQGTGAVITMTLPKWDDQVYQTVIQPAVGNAGLGFEDPGSIGTLMMTEANCTQLLLPFPYQAKAAYAAQVAGTRFFACRIMQDNWRSLGTRPRLLSLSWKANRVYLPGVSNAFGYGRWELFDTNVAGLPPPL